MCKYKIIGKYYIGLWDISFYDIIDTELRCVFPHRNKIDILNEQFIDKLYKDYDPDSRESISYSPDLLMKEYEDGYLSLEGILQLLKQNNKLELYNKILLEILKT